MVNLVRVSETEELVGAFMYLTSFERPSTTGPLSSPSELCFHKSVSDFPWTNCSAASLSPTSDRGIFASLLSCVMTVFVLSVLFISFQTTKFRFILSW